ncbi:MAG: nucleoside deaminase [Bacteroidota bacterium]
MSDEYFMQKAIELAQKGMAEGAGGPFGAIVVKDGQIIGSGYNSVTSTNDPTAHAEVLAIRAACQYLGSFQLTDCTLYTSCEPCPMCMGAIYWARPARVFYACSRQDAAAIGFDDEHIYEELDKAMPLRQLPISQLMRKEALPVFELWQQKKDRVDY